MPVVERNPIDQLERNLARAAGTSLANVYNYFASKEDIDTGMIEGCSHPIGQLQLTDLIGLDTTHAVAESLYEEFKEPLYAPPPLLSRMVDAGLLGRKAGRGFYDYHR